MAQELADKLILILEDNAMIAEGMRSQLEQNGYQRVETASTSENALRFIEKQVPAFALLDVSLGGGKTCASVATELLRRHTPFAFVTGYGEHTDFAKQFPMAKTLQKPTKTADIIATIEQML